MGTYLPGTGTLHWVVWSGVGIPHSWDIPPNIHPPHVDVGPPVPYPCTSPSYSAFSHLSAILNLSASLHLYLPLLRIWMNVTSLNPWLLDFHTVWFSDKFGWYLFCSLLVIFAIVWGGKECLPMPPYWPEVCFSVSLIYVSILSPKPHSFDNYIYTKSQNQVVWVLQFYFSQSCFSYCMSIVFRY